MFARHDLHNAPTIFFSPCRKEDGPRPGQKKRAPNAGNIVQNVRFHARISNLVQVWYKAHAESPRRPQCCLERRPRAAGWGGKKSLSEVPWSVSDMRAHRPRLTALAATLVPPVDSPPLRGVQRTLPLVAFLWSTRTISFRERKEMGLDLRRSVTANTQLFFIKT